jgi:hypothetical protein
MKKFRSYLTTFFVLNFLFIFVFKTTSAAQTPTLIPFMPDANCGNAEATVSSQRSCCKPMTVSTVSTPSVLQHIPIVGETIDKINKILLLLQRAQNIEPCLIGYPTDPSDPNCICLKDSQITPTPIEAVKKLCEKYVNPSEKSSCIDCSIKGGVWTSLTCVYGDFSRFVTDILLGWGIGLAGIIALLCIIYSAFQMQTSQGNPEKTKKAQELLTSCIMGLMLIVFSVFILRLIGVSILKIPGFK